MHQSCAHHRIVAHLLRPVATASLWQRSKHDMADRLRTAATAALGTVARPDLSVASGSGVPVRRPTEQPLRPLKHHGAAGRSAVPRIAAAQVSASGGSERRLAGAHREYARRRRPAPYGAYGELSISAVMHSARLCAGHRRRQAAGRMNAGFTGIKAEDALHITFDFPTRRDRGQTVFSGGRRRRDGDGTPPNRTLPLVTGLPSTGANEVPGIGTVRRTAGDEAAVRSLSKDSSPLAPLSMTKLWTAL